MSLSPKTAPGSRTTSTAAPTPLVSKPTGQWHSSWCSPSLLCPSCMCLLVPGQGPGSPWHTADHCIISLTQHATTGVSQSGSAGERDKWADVWLPLPSGITQPGQRKPHLGAGVKCASLTPLPGDVYEDTWPCCEGTAPIPTGTRSCKRRDLSHFGCSNWLSQEIHQCNNFFLTWREQHRLLFQIPS